MAREITAAGLTVKTVDEIRADLADAIRGKPAYGQETQTHPYSVIGQLIDAYAGEQVELDELLLELQTQLDPDTASGVFLGAWVERAGVSPRKQATASTVVLTITGTTGTTVPSGTQYRVPDGAIFATDADISLIGATADAPSTCIETGPLAAAAGTITEIVDVIVGVSAVTNALDASMGRDIETDAELRARRNRSLSAAGSGTLPSIRAALESIASASFASVMHNTSLVTDANGLPGKSVRAVLWPDTADTDEIATVLFETVSAGIYTDGSESATVTDDQGQSQVMRWDWAAEVEIHVEANVTTTAAYPESGDDDVAVAILAYLNSLRPGDDVKPDMIRGVVLLGGAPLGIDTQRVVGISALEILVQAGAPPAPGDDDVISIGVNEIAIGDSTRIDVNS